MRNGSDSFLKEKLTTLFVVNDCAKKHDCDFLGRFRANTDELNQNYLLMYLYQH